MQRLRDYVKVNINKITLSRSEKKVLRRRGLSLLLAVLLTVSVMEPLFGLFVSETKAADIFYDGNTLDGSKGKADTQWYTADTTGGTSPETAYIIKNSDELAGLAQLVNDGTTDFAGKYIRLQGLTEADAQKLIDNKTNADAQAGVIDLRKYNGNAGDTTGYSYWVPIGKDSDHPFRGELFSDSSNTVSVINMNAFTADAALISYGLVGYNEGKVRDFTISYTQYGTNESIKTGLDFSANKANNLEFIGSAVAYNLSAGVIKNITVGVGGQIYKNSKFQFEKSAVVNADIVIAKTFKNLGGVVGATEGKVEACSFYGSITTDVVNDIITAEQNKSGGVGGIAGLAWNNASGVNISDCIAKVNITVKQVGQSNAFGGIVGKTLNFGPGNNNTGAVDLSIAYGSITIENAGNDKSTDSQFGGIGGRMDGGTFAATRCISAMNITAKRYSAQKSSGATASAAVGGIAGVLTNTTINRSFSIGTLSGKTIVGGLVGNLTGYINNCYSSAAVTILSNDGNNNVGQITDYESTSGIHAAGGLAGYVGNTGASIKNSYFAGSTLKSEVGSIYGAVTGDGTFSATDNVFYDKQVSPNRAAGANRSAAQDTTAYAKTTTELQQFNFTDSFKTNAGMYPEFTYIEKNASVYENVKNLAHAFSAISTASYLDQTKTYGNAYRAQEVGASSNALVALSNTSNVSYANWALLNEYTGVQKAEILGGVYQLAATVTDAVGGDADITVARKLLLPVNTASSITEATADQIPDVQSFQRFLDIANIASGAYIGGEFTLTSDLEKIEVTPVTYGTENRMLDNLFCATLDGNSKTIAEIGFSGVSAGLFGAALSGGVQNLTVTKVALGTEATPYDFSTYQYQYAGLFCARAKATTFENITFSDVSIVLNNEKNLLSGFGLLAGYNAPGSTYVSNSKFEKITVSNAKVAIPHMGNNLYMGLLGGQLINTILNDNKIQTLDFTTQLGVCQSLGSFVGSVGSEGNPSEQSTVKNCQVTDLTAVIGGSATQWQKWGFGGIGGRIDINIANSYVSGSIKGVFTNTENDRSNAGGIMVFGNNGKNITNCTFTGTIEGFGTSGGLVAYTNYGFTINTSNVIGTITAKNVKNNYTGGLVGEVSDGGNQITGSYFYGNVTGSNAGGLVGYSTSSVAMNITYVKAIVTGTDISAYIGGLIGRSDGAIAITNSYFAGQLQGDGLQGGIAGYAPSASIMNGYFDNSIAGTATVTVASISANEESSAVGEALDKQCSKTTAELTTASLGKFNFNFNIGTDTNYPTLVTTPGASLILEADKTTFTDLSTRKVFFVQNTGTDKNSLTTRPYFKIDEGSSEFTVAPGEKDWNGVVAKNADGVYAPAKPGHATAIVTNTLPGSKTLAMKYDIRFAPFKYGSGTKDAPYIIFNANELKVFKDYVDSGFDEIGTYYKIGSVVDDKVIRNAITIDLQESTVFGTDWEPIRNFKGKLDGNNSVLENLIQLSPYTDSNASYYGLFATSAGDIKNLTLNHVKIDTAAATGTIYAGSLAAYASSGQYVGCHILNDSAAGTDDITTREPNQITGGNATAVGGLIGAVNVASNAAINLNACTVLADIEFSGSVGSGSVGGTGGVVGYAELKDSTSTFNVKNTASYGSMVVKRKTAAGGIVGGTNSLYYPINVTNCVSTMDLTVATADSLLGGILAGNQAVRPSKTSAEKEEQSRPSTIKFENCYYGGKLSYPETIRYVGGIAAVTYLYQDLTSWKKEELVKFDTKTLIVPGSLYDNTEELGQQVDKLYAENRIFTNCAYNYNVNHVPVAYSIMRCKFNYNKGGTDVGNFFDAPNSVFTDVPTARSSTQEMTDASQHTDDGNFVWHQGYYPIPTHLTPETDVIETKQNEAYMGFMARFYSTPVYYTNGDKFGDNTYSNIYLLTEEPAAGVGGETLHTESLKDNANVTVTNNGKMVQSTESAASANTVTVPLVGSYNSSYTFRKNIVFVPSVVACGVSDSSFVYANPKGMWVTEDKTSKYPWTIYTADQLQGLTAVVNNIADGNGIIANVTNYNNTALPAGTDARFSKGDTFVLGRDLDCAPYTVFDPICPDNLVVEGGADKSKAFDSQLNGLGHVITNLNITRAVNEGEIVPAYTKLGLFGQASGAEIKNVGLVNLITDAQGSPTGGVFFDKDTAFAGSLVAELKNSSVQNCFSAIPVMGEGTEAQTAGGLVGSANGKIKISGSFFTGVLYAQASEAGGAHAAPALGGILGSAENSDTTVANSYVAGFIQTTGSMAVITPKGNVTVDGNNYYDLNATGDMQAVNDAKAADLSKEQPAGFEQAATGFYPLQSVFTTNDKNTNALKTATVKIYLTNARSATGGSVDAAAGFTLERLASYHGVASVGDINLDGSLQSFTQKNSGFLFLNVGRLAAAELKCWYNDGKEEGDATVYTINTAKELLEFSMIVNGTLTAANNPNGNHEHNGTSDSVPFDFSGCVVRLGSDIDLADLPTGFPWEAIGSSAANRAFKGTFDGNGHVVTLNSSASGLFNVVDGATIQNLGLNGSIDAAVKGNVIVPLAQTADKSMITGCFSAVSINNAASAAGLVGQLSTGSTLTNSYNMGAINGNGTLAGLVLTNNGTVTNCYNAGVVSSLNGNSVSGQTAGIVLNNTAGTVANCYNAAYVSALHYYAIANGGTIDPGCAYDPKLMEIPNDAANLVKGIGSDFGGADNWVKNAGSAFYPQLKVFAAGSLSQSFQTASGLSALILRFTGKNYQEFTSASLLGKVNNQVVQLNPASYNMSTQDDEYTLSNPTGATGGQIVIASAAGFSHSYYTIAQATMKIRYKFDFSTLFAGKPEENKDYHKVPATKGEWEENPADGIYKISTADDFNSFVAYVNTGKKMTGKTIKLNYSINFENAAITPITGKFNGTFDGGYYTLSNFSITGEGQAALFAEIGEAGRVENLAIANADVTVNLKSGAAETYGSVIALENKGFIGNIALTDCSLSVNNNATTSASSYAGVLAAKNNGRITGCYFKNTGEAYVLSADNTQPDFSGSLVGYNRGTLSGCYFIGRISQIYLITGGNEGEINNCYYAAENGEEPKLAKGAYRQINADGTPPNTIERGNYWLTLTQMKTPDFATWLSSNIYGGAFEVGSSDEFTGGAAGGEKLNDGYPYLTGFELAKYDLASYFADKTTMLLSVWNTSDDATQSSISNGIFALDNLQFKYFSDIIIKAKLEFNMHELPNGIDYLVSNARFYASDAEYKKYISADAPGKDKILQDYKRDEETNWNTPLTANAASWTAIPNANLVVVTIKFRGSADDTPWGNYRTWSSTTEIESSSGS